MSDVAYQSAVGDILAAADRAISDYTTAEELAWHLAIMVQTTTDLLVRYALAANTSSVWHDMVHQFMSVTEAATGELVNVCCMKHAKVLLHAVPCTECFLEGCF
tara:strand:- start:150 stop:461 length:312 start_codon:yes stop_codon:yes gene_type:complete